MLSDNGIVHGMPRESAIYWQHGNMNILYYYIVYAVYAENVCSVLCNIEHYLN